MNFSVCFPFGSLGFGFVCRQTHAWHWRRAICVFANMLQASMHRRLLQPCIGARQWMSCIQIWFRTNNEHWTIRLLRSVLFMRVPCYFMSNAMQPLMAPRVDIYHLISRRQGQPINYILFWSRKETSSVLLGNAVPLEHEQLRRSVLMNISTDVSCDMFELFEGA